MGAVVLQVMLTDGSALRGDADHVQRVLANWAYAKAGRLSTAQSPLQDVDSGHTVAVRAINPAHVAMVTEVP